MRSLLSLLPFVAYAGQRLSTRDDAALLALLAGGDGAALDEVYRREAGAVYRYALALTGGDAAWAADATHDAFVALATRPRGYDPGRGPLGAYLAGVARHAIGARRRDHRREQPLADGGDDGAGHDDDGDACGSRSDAAAGGANPEALLVRAQGSARVWTALRRLPAPMREALVLVDLQDRPYAEAAQIAGIELNTLRTRVHRARLKLAALLGDDDAVAPEPRRACLP